MTTTTHPCAIAEIPLHPFSQLSLYSNLGANCFRFIPEERYTDAQLTSEETAQLSNCLPDNIKDIWWFGLRPSHATHEKHHTVFGLEGPSHATCYTFQHAILDSWCLCDQLCDRGNKDPLGVVISLAVLESMWDPRPLLLSLKKLSARACVTCVFYCLQRTSYVRRWSQEEFIAFLEASGFALTLPPNNSVNAVALIKGHPSCNSDLTTGWRRSPTELHCDPDLLVVTTEDADLLPTGGIGTYVKSLRAIRQATTFLYCGIDQPWIKCKPPTFTAYQLLGTDKAPLLFDGDGLIEAIKMLIYTYTSIATCELQDYQSIAFRVVQAKQTGLLPQFLQLRLFLHGSTDALKFARSIGDRTELSGVYDVDEVRRAIKDRYIYRHIDAIRAPSPYLPTQLTEQHGYPRRNVEVARLPFVSSPRNRAHTQNFGPVRNLVYLGKYSDVKGWSDFVASAQLLRKEGHLQALDTITLLAPGRPPRKDKSVLSACCQLEVHHLPHKDLVSYVQQKAAHSLFVMPYPSDNYPYTVLECALNCARFVAYRSGGTPFLLEGTPAETFFLAEPGAQALAEAIYQLLVQRPEDAQQQCNETLSVVTARQCTTNQFYAQAEAAASRPSGTHHITSTHFLKVTVATPVFNTPLQYIHELAVSLSTSSLRPEEWLIIDDGSDPSYHPALAQLAETQPFPTRIIFQKNAGLAGARNTALKESRTLYTYFIDSDDVLLPHAIATCLSALSRIPEPLAALSGFPFDFYGGMHMAANSHDLRHSPYWKPLGIPDARVISLFKNEFLPAGAMVNTDIARSHGGYNDKSKAAWEDWEFYLKLAWTDASFALLPIPTYLYRITPGSMNRTYNKFHALRRLPLSLPLPNTHEGNWLIGLVQSSRLRDKTIRDLRSRNRTLERELQDLKSRNARPILRALTLAGRKALLGNKQVRLPQLAHAAAECGNTAARQDKIPTILHRFDSDKEPNRIRRFFQCSHSSRKQWTQLHHDVLSPAKWHYIQPYLDRSSDPAYKQALGCLEAIYVFGGVWIKETAFIQTPNRDLMTARNRPFVVFTSFRGDSVCAIGAPKRHPQVAALLHQVLATLNRHSHSDKSLRYGRHIGTESAAWITALWGDCKEIDILRVNDLLET
jgi:glycosyltransferase involved in cell wall biosynthesis